MTTAFKDRNLIAVIGDEVHTSMLNIFAANEPPFVIQDSITGLLLAGIGHVTDHGKKNFLVVDASVYA